MNKDNDVKAITRKFFAAYNAHDDADPGWP